MGEFRIGRKHARHSYPDTRGGGAGGVFSRNFASGPATETDITVDGVQLPWNAVDVGTPGADVQITPNVTGIVQIDGVITMKNHSSGIVIVNIQAQVGSLGLLIPLAEAVSMPANALAAIPVLTEFSAPIGVAALVQILVESADAGGNEISIVMESSTLSLQEVSAATG